MWIKGSAAGHHDFLDKLETILESNFLSAFTYRNRGTGYAIDDTIAFTGGTSSEPIELTVMGITSGDYLSAAVVAAGGTGYAVGDLLYISGGTYSYAAECEVTSESGGVVTGIQINKTGIYSANPSSPAATTSDGSGINCTITLTMTPGIGIIDTVHITSAGAYSVDPTFPVATTTSGSGTGATFGGTMAGTNYTVDMHFREQEATSAVVAAGGTGYSVNDILTVAGGVFTTPTEFKVASITGSAVATVTVETEGAYSTTPANPLATSSPSGGSGCTLTVTWSNTDNSYLLVHNTVEEHYCGIRASYYASESAYYFKIEGFTGFAGVGVKWTEQPGYASAYSYVPSHNGSFLYWLSIKPRSIFGMTRVGTSAYPQFWMGLIDITMTEDEYPYPQMVMANTVYIKPYTYGASDFAGFPNPGTGLESRKGPGWLRLPGGTTTSIYNWYISFGNPAYTLNAVGVMPCGHQNNPNAGAADDWYTAQQGRGWYQLVRVADTDSTTKHKFRRINDKYTIVPLMLSDNDNRVILGTVPDMFWFDNSDLALQSEDRMVVDGVYYRVFQNCRKTNRNNMFIIKED